MKDYRDMVIADLVMSETELRERVVELKADVGAYREMLSFALAWLHIGLQGRTPRERDHLRHCLDEMLVQRREAA